MATENWQTSSRLTLGFAIGFSVFGLLVTLAFATMLLTRVGRDSLIWTGMYGSISESPMTEERRFRLAAPIVQSGETTFESSADQITVSGNDTSMTKVFPLVPASRFAINSISGNISVETWDEQQAEVKVIKRGPNDGAAVFFARSANSLSIRTGGPGNNHQDVRYEVKLPHNIGVVDLKQVNGSVSLSAIRSQIFVESTNGSIDLNDVMGVSSVRTANGKINAVLAGASNGPMEIGTTNGKIDVTIKPNFNAELEASSVHGSVNIDGQFGISVLKELTGQHARGQIGSGGQPLKLTAINGSVKLSKQR